MAREERKASTAARGGAARKAADKAARNAREGGREVRPPDTAPPPEAPAGEAPAAPPAPPPCTCLCQCVPVEGYLPFGIHPLQDTGVAIAHLPEAPDFYEEPAGGPAVERSEAILLQESALPGGQGDALSAYIVPWRPPPTDLPGGFLPGPEVLLPGSWRDGEGDRLGGRFNESAWSPPTRRREERPGLAPPGRAPPLAGPRVAAVEAAPLLIPGPPGWGLSRPAENTHPTPWTVMPDDTLLGRSTHPPT